MKNFLTKFFLSVSLLLITLFIPGIFPLLTPVYADNLTVYDDSLAAGWNNWSWSSSVDFQNSSKVYSGSKSLAWTPNAWGGLYLHSDSAIDGNKYSSIRFVILGGQSGEKFKVNLYDQNNNQFNSGVMLSNYGGDVDPNNWRSYSIPLNDLNANGKAIKGLMVQEAAGQNQPAVYLDNIEFVSPTTLAPTSGTSSSLSLSLSSLPIFMGSLASGFINWSWNATVSFSNQITFQSNGQWAGLYLHNNSGVSTNSYKYVSFVAKAEKSGQKYKLIAYDQNNNPIGSGALLADNGGDPTNATWTTYNIPLDKISAANILIKGLVIQDVGTVSGSLYVNNYQLSSDLITNSVSPVPTGANNPTTPVTSATNNNLSGFTTGNGAIYKNGQKIVLHGINWFGFETGTHVVHGLWVRGYKEMIAQIKSLGFNAVRVPFCPATLQSATNPTSIDYSKNADLSGLNSLGVLDKVLGELENQQIYYVLDHHTPDCQAISDLWYTGSYSESQWIADLTMLASRYQGKNYFLGLDLKNEPKGAATWGTGNVSTDWNLAAERAGKQVLATNPNIVVMVEGIQDNPNCSDSSAHFWGGNLAPARCTPINTNSIPAGKLIYSPHVYGPDVNVQSYFSDSNFPNNMPAIWSAQYGFLAQNGATVVPGEWGGKYGNGGLASDVTWANAFVSYLKSNHMCSSFYWDWNPNSGDTGGVLQDDWSTPWSNKINLLQGYFNQCN